MDISDFSPPYARGAIPLEAREVEMLVGLLDGMRADRKEWKADTLNAEMLRLANESKFRQIVPRPLHDDDIAHVPTVRNDLLKRWLATAAGDVLELKFVRG